LTYTISDGNSCINSAQAIITVYQLPVVSTGSYGPVCANVPYLPLSGTPTGGVWNGIGVSGTPGTGYVFSPSAGTQTLTYTYTDGHSCVNSSQTVIIVNPLPVVSPGTYPSVCANADNIALAGSPSGGIWSGTGVTGNQVTGYVFDPSAGTQTLTYTYTDGNTCYKSEQVVITVHPLPVVSAGSYGPVNIGSSPISLVGTTFGRHFQWPGRFSQPIRSYLGRYWNAYYYLYF